MDADVGSREEAVSNLASDKSAIINHADIDFTVVATVQEYHVDFVAYDVVGVDGDITYWHRKGASMHPDPVTSLSDAEVFLHGGVKWDGCSDWYFDVQDAVMLHGCCREDIARIGDLLGRCWDYAKENLPNWLDHD